MPHERTGGWSRESRLLLVTVAVCAGVLLLLARLRFPEPAVSQAVTAPPLERLAARASYDALAGDIQRVEPVIDANLVVLRIASQQPEAPRTGRDALTSASRVTSVRHVVALRTGTDTAMAFMGGAVRVEGIVGNNDEASASLLQRDPVRDWALLRVPTAPAPSLQRRALSDLPTPTYVVVVEGTQAGATLRPVFLGHGTRFTSARWQRPLMPLGAIAVSPGALLFTLDGAFIGAVIVDGGAPAVVGERDLFDAGARMAAGSAAAAGDLGISIQALTPELSRALGVVSGAVVADVDADGPSASVLKAGDVLTALGTRAVDDADEFLLDVAQRAGETVDVTFVRDGQSRSARVTVGSAAPMPVVTTVRLVRVAGSGTRIEAGGESSIAGLQSGDLVVRAGEIEAPTPEQLHVLVTKPTATGFVTLVVRRDGRQRLVAVPVAAEANDLRR